MATGFHRSDVKVPESKIYVTGQPSAAGSGRVRFKGNSAVNCPHFHLVLLGGHTYTQEEINDCQGSRCCRRCIAPIFGPISFFPEDFDYRTEEPTMNVLPFCRPECAWGYVNDAPNNDDLIQSFCAVYGFDVHLPPPADLLFEPGGLGTMPLADEGIGPDVVLNWSLKRAQKNYHRLTDDKVTIVPESKFTKAFFANTYYSCTLMHNHQPREEFVQQIDGEKLEKVVSLGPTKQHDRAIPLATAPLDSMGEWTVDPLSLRPATADNEHMRSVAAVKKQQHS